MTVCTDCGQPRPCLFVLLDGDGAHRRCAACVLTLAAAVERVGTEIVFMVRSAPVTV